MSATNDPLLARIEANPMYRQLRTRRNRLGWTLTIVMLVAYYGFIGLIAFDTRGPGPALVLYETGIAIAEMSLPDGFSGVLGWGWTDNRPFLRCLHGLAVTLWRLKRWDEAAAAAESLLWLSPRDNQGASAVLADVRARVPWVPSDRRHG